MFDDSMTIEETKAKLRPLVEKKGHKCPVCTQFVKVYHREIDHNMAKALIIMFQHYGHDWFRIPSIEHLWKGHNAHMLAYWDLIEETSERRDDGGRGKSWRVTDDGELYLKDQLRVAKVKRVYDGRVLSEYGEPLGVRDALAKRFNYEELMSR